MSEENANPPEKTPQEKFAERIVSKGRAKFTEIFFARVKISDGSVTMSSGYEAKGLKLESGNPPAGCVDIVVAKEDVEAAGGRDEFGKKNEPIFANGKVVAWQSRTFLTLEYSGGPRPFGLDTDQVKVSGGTMDDTVHFNVSPNIVISKNDAPDFPTVVLGSEGTFAFKIRMVGSGHYSIRAIHKGISYSIEGESYVEDF